MSTTSPRVVVAGALAQRPGRGGHAWMLLQYLLGFARLGFDVLFLDRLEPGMHDDGLPVHATPQARYLARVMERFGLGGAYALLHDGGRRTVGMGRREVVDRTREAVLLLNVMGYLEDPEILEAATNRVFLDIDPGFPQLWQERGWCDLFAGHHHHASVGANLGRPGCGLPTGGLRWIPTPPPVVLAHWPPRAIRREAAFTTVASWRGPFAPLDHDGRRHGLRVHEFRRFLPLPERTGLPFEVALDIDPADTPDRERIVAHGWRLVDPLAVAATPDGYRRYIQRSGAEVMIAKGMYVEAASGWFSDRTACYLASGRPVLAQDTGLDGWLPTDAGLVTFDTLDEAVEGAARISREPDRHGRAARAIARTHLDSDRVLRALLRSVDVELPRGPA